MMFTWWQLALIIFAGSCGAGIIIGCIGGAIAEARGLKGGKDEQERDS